MLINATVSAVSVGATIPTSDLSSVVDNGVTFTLSAAMPVGQFADGSYFVVSDSAFSITSITPISSTQDTAVENGAMKNPWINEGLSKFQGFDEFIGLGTGALAAESTTYQSSLNIDPAINGSISISLAEKASIVKAVRLAAVTNGDQWQTVEKYVTLTVLDAAPAVGTVRPGQAGTTKRLRSINDVVHTPRTYSLPVSYDTPATIIAAPADEIAIFESGGRARRFRLEVANGNSSTNYSADLSPYYARLIVALNSGDLTAGQRDAIISRVLVASNDIEALLDEGQELNSGAGQGGTYWIWIMAAAALLKDATLLAKIHSFPWQPTIGRWFDSTDLGQTANGSSGVEAQTVFSEHVGIPHMIPDEFGSHHGARYLNVAAGLTNWEQSAICTFNQGPTGFADGFAMILNGGANNNTNQKSAMMNFAARWYTFEPNVKAVFVDTDWQDTFDMLYSEGITTGRWTGPPDQPPKGNANIGDNDYFSGGTGSITLSDNGINYATETITQTDFRYSLDGVQWIVESAVTLTAGSYTKTGLLQGVNHYCGWRRSSASGTSAWSANFPYATGDPDAEVVATLGTETSAAPSNTVTPIVSYRPYPGWEHPLWDAAATTLDVNSVELAAGLGYWTGSITQTDFSFQWQESANGTTGWTDITTVNGYDADATAQEFSRRAENASQFIRCQVTCNNGVGSVTVATNVVECPALVTLPAGTLIDTAFRGAFAVDYETEFAAVVVSNCVAEHLPAYSAAENEAVNYGALFINKEGGANPSAKIELQGNFIAGESYNVDAQLGTAWSGVSGFTGTLFIEIVNAGGTVFWSGALTPADPFTTEAKTFSDTFAIGGGETDLDAYLLLRNNVSAGGTGQGDGALHSLKVQQVV